MAWNALRIPEGEGNELITVEDFDFPVSELFASYYSEKYGGKRQEMSERPEVPIPHVKDLPDWRALNQQYLELGMIEAEKFLSQNKQAPPVMLAAPGPVQRPKPPAKQAKPPRVRGISL